MDWATRSDEPMAVAAAKPNAGAGRGARVGKMTILSISDKGRLTTVAPGNNTRKKRQCHGQHGLRLSWPSANDTRRAVVAQSPSPAVSSKAGVEHVCTSEARFIHTSSCDVEMHQLFKNSQPNGNGRSVAPPLRVPLDWNPHRLDVKDKDLLEYFKHFASQALATFASDPTDLGDFLIRVSLSSNSHSGVAALKSLLAFSSAHRNGVQPQAGALKISALNALAAAAGRVDLSTIEAVQHVAASMLLYSFEVQQPCCTSNQWTWYLWGANKVIDAALHNKTQDNDIAKLLDWVHYNNIMARFALRHWDGSSSKLSGEPPNTHVEISHPATPVAILELLSDICDSVYVNSDSVVEPDDYKSFLKVLDWRIQNIQVTDSITELYQLSSLIYLDRISGALLNQFARTQMYIDKAFAILSQLSSCERQFPVFIIGCEARTDAQRAIILDLISKTESKAASRSFTPVDIILQAIWAQDDLQDGDLDYSSKLSSTISRCAKPPSFV
ncbi:hypothetical protein F5Y10DRAFT_247203 [Nemania abortiva]|nr:hypothetical protein F5Y10DRAFT_247203 [Nemania abortiva]